MISPWKTARITTGLLILAIYLAWCIPWAIVVILARIFGSIGVGAIGGFEEARAYWKATSL